MTDFEGVVPALGQALSNRGYDTLTPVQEAVLAPELKEADVLVSAQTGSGKTVAFGMSLAPTLLEGEDRFQRANVPLALIVTPTRELALQVQRELEWLYEKTGASLASCVGGMDMRTERRTLDRGAHIVVGTPGRLRDHIERGSLDLSGLRAAVLDEADEMLDMGFRDDLEFILGSSPTERRTLMFSATVPKSIANLAKRYQRNAVRISTSAEREQHIDIEYKAYFASSNEKENAIINVLRYYEAKSAIVFCATRATVNHMTSRFNNRGFSVVALSGELSQSQRTHALQSLRDGRARVCIATDVASRGIDLQNLELVIHADIPKNRESLLHRSGRTGRAGRKGVSALIVPHNARKRTERLFQNANIDAKWAKPPSVDDIVKRDDERILADPVLVEPVKAEEQAFAQQILAGHSPEQVAAAFVRLYRAGQSAPEDLLNAPPSDREERDRPRRDRKRGDSRDGSRRAGRDTSKDAFDKGVWFSLSVGRKHTAEPRWLLPALIRAGDLKKRDIGAIRIQETETYFELAPESADKFLEALGPSRKLEKSMTVNRLDAMPKILEENQGESRSEPRRESKSAERHDSFEKPRGKKKPKRKYKQKSDKPPRDFSEDQKQLADIMAKAAKGSEDLRQHKNKPKKSKPENDPEDGDVLKRGPKLKFGKAGRKGDAKRDDGSSPLKRKRVRRNS